MFVFLVFVSSEIRTIKVEQAVTQLVARNGFNFKTKITKNITMNKIYVNGYLPQLVLFHILEHWHTPRKATACFRAHQLHLIRIGEAHLILHSVEVTLVDERLFAHYIGRVQLYQMLFVLLERSIDILLLIFLVLSVLLLLYQCELVSQVAFVLKCYHVSLLIIRVQLDRHNSILTVEPSHQAATF